MNIDFAELQTLVRRARGSVNQTAWGRRVGLTQAQVSKLETGAMRELSREVYDTLTRLLGPLPMVGEAPTGRGAIRAVRPREIDALCAAVERDWSSAFMSGSPSQRLALLDGLVTVFAALRAAADLCGRMVPERRRGPQRVNNASFVPDPGFGEGS